MAEREDRAQCASKEDDVVAVVDWLAKAVLVRVQAGEYLREEGLGLLCFDIAVELEQLREQREDEGE